MARRSVCEQISEMVMRDYRLLALPPVARLLWHNLLMAMRFGGVSVLRSGERVLDANALAIVAAISVSEIEPNIELLVGCGLLVREADGALGSPLLAAVVTRSEINRANALAGVAKRRAKAAVAGQRELPIMQAVGGTDVSPPHSVSETAERTPPAGTQLAIAKLEEPKAKLAVSDAAYHSAGRAAVAAAGFDQATWMGHYGIVRQWLANGADEALIVEVIREKVERGARFSNLGYFTKAIDAALLRPRAVGDLSEGSRRFTEATQAWLRGGCKGVQPKPADFQPGGCRAVAA